MTTALPGAWVVAGTAVLRRRVRLEVAATISYNVIEAVVAITVGNIASSAPWSDSASTPCRGRSAAAIARQFANGDHAPRERIALRIIAFSFYALAAYVTVDGARALIAAQAADHSSVGIALVAVSVVVMPLRSWPERRTGRELGSASVVADSKQTLLCSYLSAVLLVGPVATSVLGWWRAAPLAALLIAAVAVREGLRRGAATRAACRVSPSSKLRGL